MAVLKNLSMFNPDLLTIKLSDKIRVFGWANICDSFLH